MRRLQLTISILAFTSTVSGSSSTRAAPETSARGEAGGAPVRILLLDANALGRWLVARNREVAAAASRVDQARADVSGSRLFMNPALDFSMTDIPVGAENEGYAPQGVSGSAIYTAGLSQTFELGKRGPRIASAGLLLDSARSAYLDTLAQKMNEARVALGRVVYLRAKHYMLEERLSSAREVLAIEQIRLKQGYMSGNDYDRLLLDTMTVEARTARNQAEVEGALRACEAILLASCDQRGGEAVDLQSAAPVPAPLPDLDAALAARPDLRALEQARQSALQDAKGARRRAIPDPTVRLGYSEDRLVVAGDQPHTLQLGVIVPLPAFNRGQYDAAKARARALELQHMIDAARERARAEAQALLGRRAYVASTLDNLSARALPRSKAVLDSSLRAFNAGQISTTDLLAVRRAHLTLLMSISDLDFEHFSVRNDLRRALGLDAVVARQAAGK